jgi:hypothetical protein
MTAERTLEGLHPFDRNMLKVKPGCQIYVNRPAIVFDVDTSAFIDAISRPLPPRWDQSPLVKPHLLQHFKSIMPLSPDRGSCSSRPGIEKPYGYEVSENHGKASNRTLSLYKLLEQLRQYFNEVKDAHPDPCHVKHVFEFQAEIQCRIMQFKP